MSLPWLTAVLILCLAAPPTKDPAPTRRTSLASLLTCQAKEHSVTAVRFSPNGELVALVLQASDNPRHSHLVVVSRDGQIRREIGRYSPGILPFWSFDAPARRTLLWSLESGHVVACFREGYDPACKCFLVGLDDGVNRPVPPPEQLIGFVKGPLLVSLSDRLEYRGMDGAVRETLPRPGAISAGYKGGAWVMPGGSGLAFPTSTGILITDFQGANGKQVDLSNPRKIARSAEKGARWNLEDAAFTERGAVLCTSVQGNGREPYCIDLASGKEAGLAPRGHRGLPPGAAKDTAEEGQRGLWYRDRAFYGKGIRGFFEVFNNIYDDGWMVWDYRAARKVCEVRAPRTDNKGALSPKGDAMVIVAGGAEPIVSIWELGR